MSSLKARRCGVPVNTRVRREAERRRGGAGFPAESIAAKTFPKNVIEAWEGDAGRVEAGPWDRTGASRGGTDRSSGILSSHYCMAAQSSECRYIH